MCLASRTALCPHWRRKIFICLKSSATANLWGLGAGGGGGGGDQEPRAIGPAACERPPAEDLC